MPSSRSDATPVPPELIVYGYTKAVDFENETARRVVSLALSAITYSTKVIETFIEPDNGQLTQFHRLIGAINFHRQTGNEQAIIVIVYERRETGQTMWQRLWAENRLNALNAELVFA